MYRIYRICSLSLGIGLIYSASSWADNRQLSYQSNPSAYTNQQWVRDPFTPSALMYETVGAQTGHANGAFGFVPSRESMRIPNMKLRGLLNQEDEFIALLEVVGVGTFMVREGDEFNIDPSQPNNAIRIDKITRLSVTVETGMLGSIRVLR